MTEQTLIKAIQLEEERSILSKKRNQAYNGHIYLKLILDDVDITSDINIDDICKIIYEQYNDQLKAIQTQIDSL